MEQIRTRFIFIKSVYCVLWNACVSVQESMSNYVDTHGKHIYCQDQYRQIDWLKKGRKKKGFLF